ncbi:LSU ribosomal protein L25P [Melghirimyces profundicolus]|uniref:Large ribosomal subunit protein bL25 n=1 Tax=Melghirimyces profundicolus TaxID=1242148 RepID=A0A2T6BGP8_9BACL|nr:50S ribosomal protein L25/general stress protein Ctc [Melghirimyces profundicolus]PTX55238.1 LSU ribosomal protein L25P [Melghirimyces profundicolus]
MAYTITVEKRESRPRSILTRLRREGRVPAVVYGKGIENELIHLENSEVIKMLQQEGTSAVYEIRFPDGKSRKVMIRELQKDRVKDQILHIDFKEVKMNEPIEAEVPVELTGEPKGVKEGGILEQQLRSVKIRCLPDEIPESAKGEIGDLEIGESITAGDLRVPEVAELLTDPQEVVASVRPPQVEQEKEAEEEAEAAAEADKAKDEAADQDDVEGKEED